MKKAILFAMHIFLAASSAFAQKQTFDVVSFTIPKGWQQQQNESGLQLSVTDKKSGAYAMAVITKATASQASANENFNNDWNRLVKATVQISAEPTMTAPTNANGWDVISGSAGYTEGANTGSATLLTATGNGQSVSVVLMTNSSQYQKELLAFINSLELLKPVQSKSNHSIPATIHNNEKSSHNNEKSSVVGLWVYYTIESNGYTNGLPVPTGGYMRREYTFYPDGTYLFRQKDWMVYVKDVLFVYESGTWSVSGNKLTITPRQGKGGWWSKATSGRTSEWGSLVKASSWKPETVTYTFDFHYYSGLNEKSLVLTSDKQTEREGKRENNSIIYSPRAADKSLIDNPPGFKTEFENKSLLSLSSPANNNVTTNTANSALANKIWEAKSYEKNGASYGNTNGSYTGGFWYYQYKFNADGTYTFVYNAASALATNPVNILQYETGTYAVNGNQLTLTPKKGADEEWSVGKINNGMSAEHIRGVLETRIKRLKTTARKLEKITYPFTVEYWQGNNANALCMKHAQNTVREGSPGQNNQTCFFETTAAKAENYNALFK